MAPRCQGKCDFLPNISKGATGRRTGRKICRICDIKIMTDEVRCPCCNCPLRAYLRKRKVLDAMI